MYIIAKTPKNQNMFLTVDKSDTINEIKIQIRERLGIPIEYQKIVFQGNLLDDDKTVKDCNMSKSAIIKIVSTQPKPKKKENPFVKFVKEIFSKMFKKTD